MNVLGMETAGPVCSVGIVDQEGVMAERAVRGRKIHSVRLLPLIEDLLAEAGLSLEELDGIAVVSGPGSFTGLRIGMTVAKTLAQVLNVPVVGVSTLEALVYPLQGAGPVWALVPARRDEVYAALYDCGDDVPREIFPPASLDVERLLETVGNDGRTLCFVGEAVEIYHEQLGRKLGSRACFCPPELNYPRGAVVAGLGRRRLQGGRGLDACTLVPEYLRPSAAELVWQRRHRGEVRGG